MNYQYNNVKKAVDAIGGPTRTANKLGVSSSTVHEWTKKDNVPNFDKATMLADLSKVPMRQLREGS